MEFAWSDKCQDRPACQRVLAENNGKHRRIPVDSTPLRPLGSVPSARIVAFLVSNENPTIVNLHGLRQHKLLYSEIGRDLRCVKGFPPSALLPLSKPREH